MMISVNATTNSLPDVSRGNISVEGFKDVSPSPLQIGVSSRTFFGSYGDIMRKCDEKMGSPTKPLRNNRESLIDKLIQVISGDSMTRRPRATSSLPDINNVDGISDEYDETDKCPTQPTKNHKESIIDNITRKISRESTVRRQRTSSSLPDISNDINGISDKTDKCPTKCTKNAIF